MHFTTQITVSGCRADPVKSRTELERTAEQPATVPSAGDVLLSPRGQLRPALSSLRAAGQAEGTRRSDRHVTDTGKTKNLRYVRGCTTPIVGSTTTPSAVLHSARTM
jgi:hypothetical protein